MRRLLITSKRWTQPTRPSQMTGRSARCGLSLPCTRTWPQKDRSTEPCHSAAVPGKHSAKGKTPQQPQEATDSGTPIVCSVNNTYWFPGTRKGERPHGDRAALWGDRTHWIRREVGCGTTLCRSCTPEGGTTEPMNFL